MTVSDGASVYVGGDNAELILGLESGSTGSLLVSSGATIRRQGAMRSSDSLRHLKVLVLASLILCASAAAVEAKTAPEAARAHYEAATKHAEQGALPAAVIELKNALQGDPDFAEARLLLGEVYLQLGDAKAAEKELRVAARLGEEKSRIAVPLGRALLLQGRFDQVLAELSAEEFQPEIATEILLLRADAHAGLGQAEAAHALYDELAERSPREPRAYLGRARLALAAGDLQAAETQAGEALGRQPGAVEALLVQAEARRLSGRPEEALAPFRAALESKPAIPATTVRARLGLATALLALGRDMEAEREVAAVGDVAPRLPLAAYLGAVIKLRQQDIDGARQLLRAAQPVLAGFAPAQFLLGIVAYADGELETSRTWLVRYLNAQPQNLQARKLLVVTLLRLNAVGEAAKLLEVARAQAPDDPQVLLLMGNAELRAGRAAEASALLQRAAELAPEDPRVLGQLAVSHLATGQNSEALAALNATLDLNEDASALGYAMVFVHLRAGAFADALQVAEDLRRKFPESAVAANLEGGAHAGLGQLEQARSAFETALGLDPAFHQARANLAALKVRAGDLAGAEAAYQALLQAEESHPRALMGMAGLAERRGDRAAMRDWLERAVKAEPGAVQPSLALAEYHTAAGDAAAAVAVLEALAMRQPRNPQVLMALGRYQHQAGEAASAVATYTRLVEATGGSAAAHLLLAEAQLRANDLEAARSSYEELAKLAPDDPVVWNNLAWLYHQAGDGRAAAYGERALELAPGQPAVMDTLGWILLDDKAQTERAASLLEQAHKAAPGSGDIAYHYAVALHRVGKDPAAHTLLQALLQEDRSFSTRAEAEALLRALTR